MRIVLQLVMTKFIAYQSLLLLMNQCSMIFQVLMTMRMFSLSYPSAINSQMVIDSPLYDDYEDDFHE
jgi:hypothetical protein